MLLFGISWIYDCLIFLTLRNKLNFEKKKLFQAELSFQTGQIIHVYGDMDDDGFFMAEIDGVRGLVPSNFLAEANDQYAPAGPSNQGLLILFYCSTNTVTIYI